MVLFPFLTHIGLLKKLVEVILFQKFSTKCAQRVPNWSYPEFTATDFTQMQCMIHFFQSQKFIYWGDEIEVTTGLSLFVACCNTENINVDLVKRRYSLSDFGYDLLMTRSFYILNNSGSNEISQKIIYFFLPQGGWILMPRTHFKAEHLKKIT